MSNYYEVEKRSCWTFLGVEFAPIRVPLRRRMQTLTVASLFVSLLLAMFIIFPIFFYILLFTQYWYIPTLCFVWIYYDRKTPYQGGRKWNALRKSQIWALLRDYFPVKLVKTADLPSDGNFMFCVYPHGIACAAALVNFQTNANNFDKLYPGLDPYIVTLNANYRIPFTKDIYLALGGIGASESSIRYCLDRKPGSSCVLMPGGAKEALMSVPGTSNILLKNRKGFIRIALKTGASLVPVYSFGENEIFDQITGKTLLWLQDWLRRLWGLAPCLIKGRGFFQYTFGILPHRRVIVSVVGKPISLPKVEKPSMELIDEYHQRFEQELISLFNEYKEQYHCLGKEATLTIS